MQKFLDQAIHNQSFYDSIVADRYYDWKITVLFYVAVHILRALGAKEGIDIGRTHQEIAKSVNPDSSSAKMKINRGAWRSYSNLYQYSRNARYEGLTDPATFEKLMQVDHTHCIKHLSDFKKYISSRGVPCN